MELSGRIEMSEIVRFLIYLFGLGGRLDRSEFWRAVLYLIALWFALGLIAALVQLALGGREGSAGSGLAVLISSVPIAVRRLHDRDRSAWWLLAFYGLPAGLELWATPFDDTGVAWAAGAALAAWGLVELGCLRGTPGPNRFGA